MEESKDLKELKEFIKEGKELISRLRKILNTMIVIAGIIFVPFLYSFVDVQVRLHGLQTQVDDIIEDMMPTDKMYEIFVQKADALAVHMYERDWENTQFYKITHDEEYKNSDVKVLIENFFDNTHRSTNNN